MSYVVFPSNAPTSTTPATDILSAGAMGFVAGLERAFSSRRRDLLRYRRERAEEIDTGDNLGFPLATAAIREDSRWHVAPAPPDLRDRRVEIAAPADQAKIVINALNSQAQVWVADLEDATAPTWHNLIASQRNLLAAVERRITHRSPEGRLYQLDERTATIVVRPRGWHLPEVHFQVDGHPISGSLMDAGLYFFHCAHQLLERGSGPYLYLPKLESRHDARLWRDVFEYVEHALRLPGGSIRATALIETISSAYEMEEILHALGPYASGLTAGRWDYFFSIARDFRLRPEFVFPDRAELTMARPFMRAYTDLLIDTCHRRGAHALGGVATQIPDRLRPELSERTIESVRIEKEREAIEGFDGTWVVHPDLVPICRAAFDRVLLGRPHQIVPPRQAAHISAEELTAIGHLAGHVTEQGLRSNLAISIRYLEAWLRGKGSVRLFGLMEGTATVELARAQIWQWLHHGTRLQDGRQVTRSMINDFIDDEIARYRADADFPVPEDSLQSARDLLEETTVNDSFPPFLTLIGYEQLATTERRHA
jgi:malate synthase